MIIPACVSQPKSCFSGRNILLLLFLNVSDREEVREEIFKKGQSKRIWGELYKVLLCCCRKDQRATLECGLVAPQLCFSFIRSSIHLMSSSKCWMPAIQWERAPRASRPTWKRRNLGSIWFLFWTSVTWSPPGLLWVIDTQMNASHLLFIHIIYFFFVVIVFFFYILNQKRWVAVLSPEHPTLAFHASLTNSFGKGSLIQLLRQFGKVSISEMVLIGQIGYNDRNASISNHALRS